MAQTAMAAALCFLATEEHPSLGGVAEPHLLVAPLSKMARLTVLVLEPAMALMAMVARERQA